MGEEGRGRLERWGVRVSVMLGGLTFLGTVLAAGAWAQERRDEIDGLRSSVAGNSARVQELERNLEILNRNLIRMAVKAGVPRSEMEEMK